VLSNTTEDVPYTNDNVPELLAVKVLISVIAPRLTENAPASAMVTALEIIAMFKLLSD